MMGKNLEWNNQQNFDDENQKTIHNINFKLTHLVTMVHYLWNVVKRKMGINEKSKFSKKLVKIDEKQFRILVNGRFCRITEKICFDIINGKKKLIRLKHGKYGFFDSTNRFPDDQKIPYFKKTFLFRDFFLQFLVFKPNVFNNGFHRFDNKHYFSLFGINGFDGNFQFRFCAVFGFFDTFY